MSSKRDDIKGQVDNPNSCQDSLRYHLVEESGRYKFKSVSINAPQECSSSSINGLIDYLEGRFLDEIDIDVIGGSTCSRATGCPSEFAKVIEDLRTILLD